MELIGVYLIVSGLIFTIMCIMHSDEISNTKSPMSPIGPLETALLIAFICLLWPYTIVARPIMGWWSRRGTRL